MSQWVLGDNNDLRSEAAPVPSDGFCGVIEEREVQRDSVVSVGLLLCQTDPVGIGLDGGGQRCLAVAFAIAFYIAAIAALSWH